MIPRKRSAELVRVAFLVVFAVGSCAPLQSFVVENSGTESAGRRIPFQLEDKLLPNWPFVVGLKGIKAPCDFCLVNESPGKEFRDSIGGKFVGGAAS